MAETNTDINSEEKPLDTPGDTGTSSVADADPCATLRAERDEAQRLADTYKDQMLRRAAEFENYKRRVESESAAIMRSANEGLLFALLPVVDDFVRSLKAGKEAKDAEAFYSGVEMIHTKLLKVLERFGVVPFDSVGTPFDVGFHDALLQIPRADVDPHTVVEEVERGYMLFDRVLRHAKVVVSAAPETPEKSNGQA
jgi:molecular chaperone GrpE